MTDIFEEALEQGMDPTWVERFRAFNDGSPIRKENKTMDKQLKEARDENARLRKSVLATNFEKVGIGVDPSVLNLPEDVDYTNVDSLREWAQKTKLISTEPSAPQEELDAHDRIEEMANGGTPPSNGVITPATVAPWSTERKMRFSKDHPREWEALKRGEEVTGISLTSV